MGDKRDSRAFNFLYSDSDFSSEVKLKSWADFFFPHLKYCKGGCEILDFSHTLTKTCCINEENSFSQGWTGRYLLNEPGRQNMC